MARFQFLVFSQHPSDPTIHVQWRRKETK